MNRHKHIIMVDHSILHKINKLTSLKKHKHLPPYWPPCGELSDTNVLTLCSVPYSSIIPLAMSPPCEYPRKFKHKCIYLEASFVVYKYIPIYMYIYIYL